MAFVYRSGRFISHKPTTLAGPGEYHLRKDTLQLSSSHVAPFNVRAKRNHLCLNEDTPGPGTYVIHSKAFTKKHSFTINKTNPNALPFDPLNNETKDYRFVSAAPRFQDAQPDKKSIPGPGHYDLINDKKVERNVYLYEKNVPKYETLESSRVSSIPSKYKAYGFMEDGNGKFRANDDPYKDVKYSGEKDNSVGPGRYNVKCKSRKRGGVVDWSLSSSKDNKCSHTEVNTIINDDTHPNVNVNVNTNHHHHHHRHHSNRHSATINKRYLTYNKDYNFNADKSHIDLASSYNDNNIIHSLPGPGSYSPMKVGDNKRYLPKLKQYQNFGSASHRSLTTNTSITNSHNKITSSASDSYFLLNELKDKYSSSPKKSYSNIMNANNNIKRNNMNDASQKNILLKEELKCKVGPGSYNLNTQIHRPSSNIGNFNVLAKRFPITNTEPTPGAGSYLNIDVWAPDRPLMNTIRSSGELIVTTNCERGVNCCLGVNKYDQSFPGVGQYDPDIVNTIEYKVQRSKHNRKFAPFSGSDKRFRNIHQQNRLNTEVGPGSYNLRKEIDYAHIKQMKSPFMFSSKRNSSLSNITNDDTVNIGPGEYNHFDHFEWNKKSFNALFI